MAFKPQPLNSSFLFASIIGLAVSAFWIPQFSDTWAFTFGLVFFLMMIASFISMHRAAPDEQLGTKKIK